MPKSKAAWKLWGSEVMLMSLQTAPGQNANHDQWDGYGAERQEILDSFVAAGVKNLAALTGDIHTFFAGDLYTTGVESGTQGRRRARRRLGDVVRAARRRPGSRQRRSPRSPRPIPTSSTSTSTTAATWWSRPARTSSTPSSSRSTPFTKGAKPVSLKKFRVASGDPTLQVV